MSLSVKVVTVILLICFVNFDVFADRSSDLRARRSVSAFNLYENGLLQQDNEYDTVSHGLLDTLLVRPSKRQWCRKGMTYNHVLGTCTMSFAALRGKGRRN